MTLVDPGVTLKLDPPRLVCDAKDCENPVTHRHGYRCCGLRSLICAAHAASVQRILNLHGKNRMRCHEHGQVGALKEMTILEPLA